MTAGEFVLANEGKTTADDAGISSEGNSVAPPATTPSGASSGPSRPVGAVQPSKSTLSMHKTIVASQTSSLDPSVSPSQQVADADADSTGATGAAGGPIGIQDGEVCMFCGRLATPTNVPPPPSPLKTLGRVLLHLLALFGTGVAGFVLYLLIFAGPDVGPAALLLWHEYRLAN